MWANFRNLACNFWIELFIRLFLRLALRRDATLCIANFLAALFVLPSGIPGNKLAFYIRNLVVKTQQ